MSGCVPLLEENEMAKNLYVGNLAFTTTSPDLSELFGAIGEVKSAGKEVHAHAHSSRRSTRTDTR